MPGHPCGKTEHGCNEVGDRMKQSGQSMTTSSWSEKRQEPHQNQKEHEKSGPPSTLLRLDAQEVEGVQPTIAGG